MIFRIVREYVKKTFYDGDESPTQDQDSFSIHNETSDIEKTISPIIINSNKNLNRLKTSGRSKSVNLTGKRESFLRRSFTGISATLTEYKNKQKINKKQNVV